MTHEDMRVEISLGTDMSNPVSMNVPDFARWIVQGRYRDMKLEHLMQMARFVLAQEQELIKLRQNRELPVYNAK